MGTSCNMLTTARHGGDVKGIYFLTLLLSLVCFLFINVILLFAMKNDTIVIPLD